MRRSRLSRLGATAALAIFLLAEASVSVHTAVVWHAICAEHGETTELTARDSSPPSHLAPESGAVPLVRGGFGASSESDAAHEHCPAVAATRQAPAPQHVSIIAPARVEVAVAGIPGSSLAAVRLFRLAPKASPPAIG